MATIRADIRARQMAIEERVALHHMAAQMNVLAKVGKLGGREAWLEQVRPQKPRTVGDMILALQDAAAQGAPITFEQVEG